MCLPVKLGGWLLLYILGRILSSSVTNGHHDNAFDKFKDLTNYTRARWGNLTTLEQCEEKGLRGRVLMVINAIKSEKFDKRGKRPIMIDAGNWAHTKSQSLSPRSGMKEVLSNGLNFLSSFEAYVALAARAQGYVTAQLTDALVEWKKQYLKDNNKQPTPREVNVKTAELEVTRLGLLQKRIADSLPTFDQAMAHVANNADFTRGFNYTTLVEEIKTKQLIDAQPSGKHGKIGFRMAVDLVYHWLKHGWDGTINSTTTMDHYLDAAIQTLEDGIKNGTIQPSAKRRAEFEVKKGKILLVVHKPKDVLDIAYIKTFFN